MKMQYLRIVRLMGENTVKENRKKGLDFFHLTNYDREVRKKNQLRLQWSNFWVGVFSVN